MTTIPSEAPLHYPYTTGKTWAGEYFTVIPGTKIEKSPMTKFKHLVWPERTLPTKEEIIKWRVLGITEEANPLLLLDSPYSDAYCLCVVDVDHPPALKPVLEWLLSLGITSTLAVQSGREGGGVHLYFRRRARDVAKYRSLNKVPMFGTFKDAAGKERGCVDFKAYNSYVVAPGAVHKSGKVYTATWGGSEVTALSDVLMRLPVMPLEAWLEAAGRTGDEDREKNTTWVVNGKEWEQVVADGRERQPCPWCNRGDSRVLVYKPEKGTARCWYEKTTRKLCKALPSTVDPNTSILDAILATIEPSEQEEGEIVLTARHWAGFLLEEKYRRVTIDPDDIPILEEDHILFGQEKKLGIADRLLQSRYGADVGRWISCSKAPFVCVGSGSSKAGRYTEDRTACRSMTCPDCGPHLLEAMRAAVIGEAVELTFGSMSAVGAAAFVETLEEAATNVPGLSVNVRPHRLLSHSNRSLCGRTRWCAVLTRSSVGHRPLAKMFERHSSDTEGAFTWCGIQVSPLEVTYILFFATDGSGDPKAGSALWYLLEKETPMPGRFDLLVEQVFEQVNFAAWLEDIAKGSSRRMIMLVGPSALTAKIQATFDWLTGRARKNTKPKDSQRYAIASFKPTDVRQVIEEVLQENIILEEDSRTKRSGGTSKSAKLSTSPGPLMRTLVKDGKVKSCSGHRRRKKIDLDAINLDQGE